ncbi:MAG: hypothetical protein K9N23_23245 [Akkermansiaceae bacterium]|nr:hypothetical protein [Akkermansiaceae bacterium]
MKTIFTRILILQLAITAAASAQAENFTNFIRQLQFPTGVAWDASVAAAGQQLSALAIDPGGARFELWTVNSSPFKSYLLDSQYVGTYVPLGTVTMRSEDPYDLVPRTRADRPFYVDITVDGLRWEDYVPESAKKVKFLRHTQSYGLGGTGENIDRTMATLVGQVYINQNGPRTLSFALTAVAGADRSKVRGEERFSIFSLADYQAPENQLASRYIQIWPVADGSISGISQGQLLRFAVPQLTLTLNDLYPDSTTYAQVYKGSPVLGQAGKVVPGSALTFYDSVPTSRVLVVKDYQDVFDSDGRWTMEIVTKTPFGIDRLAYVSFDVQLTIKVRGTVTTVK